MGVAIPQVITEDKSGGAQVIDGGLRFDSSKSHYLTRTPSSAGNRTTWTWSGWVKRSKGSDYRAIITAGSNNFIFRFENNETLVFYEYTGSGFNAALQSVAFFRDFSSWYHIVFVLDTTNATSADRVRIYVNGQRITSFASSGSYTQGVPSSSYQSYFNNNIEHRIGGDSAYSTRIADGSMSQFYFIDGQALDASYFGYTDPLTNTWRPKKFKPAATPNNGTTWSSAGNFSGDVRSQGDSYGPPKMFNGIIGNESTTGAVCFAPYSSDSTCTWTSPTTFTGLTSLRLYVDLSGTTGKLTVNGVDYSSLVTALSGGDGWITIPQSSLSTISFGYTGGLNSATGIAAVEVNGVTLLDSDITNIGTNGFYLPLDGNTPIGQDQSGRGNNWTPVNFGGSNTIEKATGALPILNTDGGGKTAQPGVLGSKVAKTYTVTVPGGTGGGFYLDGVQKPTLSFIRGATYTFDQSDASNSGHPLQFSGTLDGGTYTDGVVTNGTPGSAGAYTRITVPHDSVNTLYYKCGNHSGMGASISVTTDVRKADLYAWKNVLALPLVGNANDVSHLIDSGESQKTVTVSGATAISSFSNFYGGSYDFDGTNDALTFTISGGLGSGDFTIEYWVYQDTLTDYQTHFSSTRGSTGFNVGTDGSGDFVWYSNSARQIEVIGAITTGRWYHWAFVRSGSTITGYLDGVAKSSFSSSVDYSASAFSLGALDGSGEWTNGKFQDLRIYKGLAKYTQNFIPASTDPDILPDTPSGVSYSSNVALVPSTDGAVAFGANTDYLNIGSSNDYSLNGDFTVELYLNASFPFTSPYYPSPLTFNKGGTETQLYYNTASSFISWYYNGGDVVTASLSGGWNHIAVTRSGSTVYMFINGILRSSATNANTFGGSASYPSYVGVYNPSSGSALSGFISNLHLVKGTALYTSNFTPPTAPISSVANTKLLCCKSNSSATAADVTPGTITANGNAAATNFNPFTVNINTVRGQESGYATLNPLDIGGGTLSNGNLEHTYSSSNIRVKSTISIPTTGKWYAEFVASNAGGGNSLMGVATAASALTGTNWYLGNDAGSWGLQVGSGTMYTYHNGGFSSFGTANNGDVIAVAVDRAAGKIWWAVNNIWIAGGDPVSGTNARYTNIPSTDGLFFAISNANNSSIACNFGQKPFKFPPPAGFQPLALANTPRPSIVRPDQYVGIVTYTGNGVTQSINVGWKPDFVWLKSRGSVNYHELYDTIRGKNRALYSNVTAAEEAADGLISFDTKGFTTGDYDPTNALNGTYVAWCWKAGGEIGVGRSVMINDVGYATASAAGLTAGTITPTGASVNTKSGFSIIKYSHTINSPKSIPHGLTKAPEFMIAKFLDGTTNWNVYHAYASGSGGGPETGRFLLNSTNAYSDEVDVWNDTLPTNQVWTVGGSTWQGSGNHITYLWHSVPGFSKFGSYTGNNSTDGPVIITGFRPRWIMIKRTDSSDDWQIRDTTINTYNPMQKTLFANLSQAEVTLTDRDYDILSNGFKIRGTDVEINASGGTYIYAAWAETPSFNLYGAQSNAR